MNKNIPIAKQKIPAVEVLKKYLQLKLQGKI